MSKSIKIIFTLSLLLNLVLVGVSAGCVWKKFSDPKPFKEVSDQTRDLFRASFKDGRESMRADIDTLRAVRAALEPIIVAESFDRGAYNAQVEKVMGVRENMNRRRADILGDVLEQLPQGEREKVAQGIARKLTDDRPSHHRKGHKHKQD